MTRNISQTGIDLIKTFEGFRDKAYKCLSSEKYYTIGYGHYGSDVQQGQSITKAQAEVLLAQDLKVFVAHVNRFMPKYNFNQNQFDALVSFAYNIGSISQLTANGTRSITAISNKMLEYNKSGGKVISGLTVRRMKERELFLTPLGTDDYYTIACEVIEGKWGNGNTRKTALTKAGYEYKKVQNMVNAILKGEA